MILCASCPEIGSDWWMCKLMMPTCFCLIFESKYNYYLSTFWKYKFHGHWRSGSMVFDFYKISCQSWVIRSEIQLWFSIFSFQTTRNWKISFNTGNIWVMCDFLEFWCIFLRCWNGYVKCKLSACLCSKFSG